MALISRKSITEKIPERRSRETLRDELQRVCCYQIHGLGLRLGGIAPALLIGKTGFSKGGGLDGHRGKETDKSSHFNQCSRNCPERS